MHVVLNNGINIIYSKQTSTHAEAVYTKANERFPYFAFFIKRL